MEYIFSNSIAEGEAMGERNEALYKIPWEQHWNTLVLGN